ncbi:MAG: hypothetical protein FWD78_06885 [Treponema sp.]|nr:hypothetical protein [Treponema sp.]
MATIRQRIRNDWQLYKKISQTIVNLPHFISVVVLVGMVFQIFNTNTGHYNQRS